MLHGLLVDSDCVFMFITGELVNRFCSLAFQVGGLQTTRTNLEFKKGFDCFSKDHYFSVGTKILILYGRQGVRDVFGVLLRMHNPE